MVTRVFRRSADLAGLPETIRLHDLRHTAITSAISQGEDIMLVAAFAGHAKTSDHGRCVLAPAAEAGSRGRRGGCGPFPTILLTHFPQTMTNNP
jgi:hypothetical protein